MIAKRQKAKKDYLKKEIKKELAKQQNISNKQPVINNNLSSLGKIAEDIYVHPKDRDVKKCIEVYQKVAAVGSPKVGKTEHRSNFKEIKI